MLIGLLGASAKLAANRPLRALASGYTTLIRSVPDLVIMLLLFFSLQILLNRVTDALGIGQVDIDPFAAGCVTLAFIYGAYFTETFRGAFQAVPAGQVKLRKPTAWGAGECSAGYSCRRCCATPCRASATTGRCWSSPPRWSRSSASATWSRPPRTLARAPCSSSTSPWSAG